MIDTLTLKHTYSLKDFSPEYALSIGAKKVNSEKENPRYALNPPKGDSAPRNTIVFPPDNRAHVYSEFEVSKLLHGHNAILPDEIEAWTAIRYACAFTSKLIGLPFEAEAALVARIDYAKDFDVGEANIMKTLAPLPQITIPRYQPTKAFGGTTIIFPQSNKQVCVYSKHHDVMSKYPDNLEAIESAKGKIRVECRLKRKPMVCDYARRLKLGNPIAKNMISSNVSDLFISQALSDIGPRLVLSHEDTGPNVIDILFNSTSPAKALRQCGFLYIVEKLGDRREIAQNCGLSKRAVDDGFRALRKLGLL